jgi:hypothetical protein
MASTVSASSMSSVSRPSITQACAVERCRRRDAASQTCPTCPTCPADRFDAWPTRMYRYSRVGASMLRARGSLHDCPSHLSRRHVSSVSSNARSPNVLAVRPADRRAQPARYAQMGPAIRMMVSWAAFLMCSGESAALLMNSLSVSSASLRIGISAYAMPRPNSTSGLSGSIRLAFL